MHGALAADMSIVRNVSIDALAPSNTFGPLVLNTEHLKLALRTECGAWRSECGA
ncbi:hypothetical protein T492DRAFT_869606 [Pavlovales sp. CCMP2436]|nr:hypothetical protein T492DRAFT_869606 [Pavlovales sp. CCMP2436]